MKPKPINGMADAMNTLFSCGLVGTELVRRFRVAAAAAALAKQCWEPPLHTAFKLRQGFRRNLPGKPYLVRRKACIMAQVANVLCITGWDGTPRKDCSAARHPHLHSQSHPTTTTIVTRVILQYLPSLFLYLCCNNY